MKPHWIETLEGDSDEIPAGTKLARITPAEQKDVDFVLNQPVDTGDGRSSWVWIRLADGTCALATFPQGDTYEAIGPSGGLAPFYPEGEE